MHQGDGAREGGWRYRIGFQVKDLVVDLGQFGAFLAVREEIVVIIHDRIERTVDLRGCRGTAQGDGLTTITQDMVPDCFQSVGWNRERAGHDGVAHPITVVQQFGCDSVFPEFVIDMLGKRGTAASLIHRHEKLGPVPLEHGDVAVCELVPVQVEVASRDHEQGIVFRVGIHFHLPRAPGLWRCR